MNTPLKVLTLAGLLVMVACASDKTRDDGTSGSASSDSRSSGPSSDSTSGSSVGAPSATGGTTGSLPGGNILYFEFDSSELNRDGAALAEAWAQYLAANASARVRLEGHGDERGTREYNVALGERRGNAVLQALTSRGVSERQISVSSFGEERPVAAGHDESAWSQNRRVEIVQ